MSSSDSSLELRSDDDDDDDAYAKKKAIVVMHQNLSNYWLQAAKAMPSEPSIPGQEEGDMNTFCDTIANALMAMRE
uniref:Uncharacterized protein n=1 Tax=Arundo donax TaxID=35708 RepID=A0A0A9GSJ4_ARUDO